MIAVALPEERYNIGSLYLNKLKAIEFFISSFEQGHTLLIDQFIRNPIALPEHNRDQNYQKLCLRGNMRISVTGKTGRTHITAQELSCLRLWLQGLRLKEIANILLLSVRTVETYIMRVKIRSGFTQLSDLLQMISSCP